MATLQEMLLRPDVQPRVVSDTLALVDSELASKSGLSGTAVKVAFKAITAFAPGYYQETVAGMVPDMVNQLAPFWADFQVSGERRLRRLPVQAQRRGVPGAARGDR